MADLSFFALLLCGWIIVLILEQGQLPAPRLIWQRPWPVITLNAGIYLVLFCIELLLFRRPYFAMAMVVSLYFFMVRVNNAKLKSLREPLLISDFSLFGELLRHPGLYLPFFGYAKAAVLLCIFIATCFIGMKLESPLTDQGRALFLRDSLLLFIPCCSLAWLGLKTSPALTLDPNNDVQAHGLFATLASYHHAARNIPALSPHGPFVPDISENLPTQAGESDRLPHIVMAQCESFFDIRRLDAAIHPHVLQQFDQLCAEGCQSGQLAVAAWGANTLRTEFSILTGIANDRLGVHRFNPYQKLARNGLPTIASYLKKRGYRTVCVHPFATAFYGRDKIFPLFGFDEFIDIHAFNETQKSGAYIGDQAVAEKIQALLSQATQPLFVFAITMENHGPLHSEKVGEEDIERFYNRSAGSPPPHHDLIAYLRHLANTDAMLGNIKKTLAASSRPGWLCAFGDHVPILTNTYKQANFSDGRVDYVLYANHLVSTQSKNILIETTPENLTVSLLQQAGLLAKPLSFNAASAASPSS